MNLLPPTNMARLSDSNIVANVSILANQDPQGVFSLRPLTRPLVGGCVSVEEGVGYVNMQVTRTQGTFGTVGVTMATTPALATSAAGKHKPMTSLYMYACVMCVCMCVTV